MRNLIMKDFLVLKSSRLAWIGLLYSTFVIFDRGGDGSAFGTSTFFMILITYIFVNYLNSYDYMYHGDLFVNAFPVSRQEVVASRYVSVLVLAVGFFALTYGLRAILWMLGYPYVNGVIDIPQFTVVILAISLYYSFLLPAYFKWGYERLRWMNIISLIVAGAASSFAGMGFAMYPIFSQWWMPLFAMGIGSVILIGSVQIAGKTYGSRDF